MKALMSCQGIQTTVMAALRRLSSPPAVPRGFVLLLLSLGTLGCPGSGGENPRGEFLKKNELQLTYLPLCSEGQLDQKLRWVLAGGLTAALGPGVLVSPGRSCHWRGGVPFLERGRSRKAWWEVWAGGN